jgi:hypothetical protein
MQHALLANSPAKFQRIRQPLQRETAQGRQIMVCFRSCGPIWLLDAEARRSAPDCAKDAEGFQTSTSAINLGRTRLDIGAVFPRHCQP